MKKKYLIIPIIATLLFSCTSETNDNKANSDTTNQLTYEVLSERNLSSSNISKSNIFTISGTGSVKQSADFAIVHLGVESREKNIKSALENVNLNVIKIIEIADSLGVEQNNIITDKFSIRPVERWIEKKDEYGGTYNSPEIIAYEVSNQIRITIEGESKETIIPDLIDKSAIETEDFFRLFSVEFKVKNLEDSLNLARNKAVKDALDKSELFEKSLGIELGKLVFFEEVYSSNYLEDNNKGGVMRMAAAPFPSSSVFAGEKEIISEINLGFEIK